MSVHSASPWLRQGFRETEQNIGLWHGASWMFVLWGALHGAALVAHRIWQGISNVMGVKMPHILAWLLTFLFINIAWVFFRATDFPHALRVLEGMDGVNGLCFSAHAFSIHVFNTIFDAHLIYVAISAVLGLFKYPYFADSVHLDHDIMNELFASHMAAKDAYARAKAYGYLIDESSYRRYFDDIYRGMDKNVCRDE